MFFITNKTYDKLKFIAQILLPALGTLYFALSQIWNLPLSEEIVGTITVIIAFLATILRLSSNNYHKINNDISLLENLKEIKTEEIIEGIDSHIDNHEVQND